MLVLSTNVGWGQKCVPSRYWNGLPVLKRTWPYDMWSLGVSWLELVLGTRHVFQVCPVSTPVPK